MIIDDITLYKLLGKGTFGEVFLTSKQGSKKKFATKRINKKYESNPKTKKYIDNEINILKEINHPSIIKLYEIHETSQYYYLVMDYCNGRDLYTCLEEYKKKNNRGFPEEIVQYLMKEIVSGINYLHQNNILHRDIKLDNILVNFDSTEDLKSENMLKAKIKIIDFGFARHLSEEELAYSILGSPINMDPGILRKLNKMQNSRDYGYDKKADIWSLGTICYEMLIGRNPFISETMIELLKRVEKGNYYLPNSLSKEVVSFLNGMLQYDPKKRLTSEQLLHHKFLTKPFSELNKIDLKMAKNHMQGSIIQINSKQNQSIWKIFETDEDNLDNIEAEMFDEDKKYYIIDNKIKKKNEKGNENEKNNQKEIKKNDNDIKNEFLKSLISMNEDFIYIEPKLIPVIPGDDPAVISKVTEFNEEDFQ